MVAPLGPPQIARALSKPGHLALAEAQSLLVDDDPAAHMAAVKKADRRHARPGTSLRRPARQARGGHMRQARKVLKQAWQKTPHAVLAEARQRPTRSRTDAGGGTLYRQAWQP